MFWSLAGSLTEDQKTVLSKIDDVFFRVTVGPSELTTPVVQSGTHQGVQLTGAAGALMTLLSTVVEPEPDLFGGAQYTNPLGSSWNLSGDPAGSIVSMDRATQLAEAQGIELVVAGPSAEARGSYPIIELVEADVLVHREGPGLTEVLDVLRCASSRASQCDV